MTALTREPGTALRCDAHELEPPFPCAVCGKEWQKPRQRSNHERDLHGWTPPSAVQRQRDRDSAERHPRIIPRAVRRTPAERFWAKVDASGDCWEWTGSRTAAGYGMFRANGRHTTAHRVAWEFLVGPVPSDLEVDHLCRNRACVNPDHLEPVTPSVNISRGIVGHRERRVTRCPAGHPYDHANTYRTRAGHRVCRACHRIKEVARKARLIGAVA